MEGTAGIPKAAKIEQAWRTSSAVVGATGSMLRDFIGRNVTPYPGDEKFL